MGTAIEADLPGPLPDVSLAGRVLTWNGTRWDLSTGAEFGASIALADLSDVTAKTGTGTVVVMQTSPTITTPTVVASVNDTNGNELIGLVTAGSAVNYLQIANAATGDPVVLSAEGDDPEVDLIIEANNITLDGPLLTITTTNVQFNSTLVVINGYTVETQNNKAAASGYCDLDSSTLVPVARLPVSDMAFVDSPVQTGRVIQLIKRQGVDTLISIGIDAPTETLPGISADGDNFAIKRYLTAATTNSTAGLITPVLFRIGYNVDCLFVVTSGSVITSYRQWVGLTNTTLGLVATPTTQHVAAISYDSARDGTVFWRTVTCNGTSATVTATSVAIAASTFYTVRIVTTPTTVAFYINGTLTNTHTTTLPGNATNLTMEACVTTLTTATRRFEFSRFGALIP